MPSNVPLNCFPCMRVPASHAQLDLPTHTDVTAYTGGKAKPLKAKKKDVRELDEVVGPTQTRLFGPFRQLCRGTHWWT